MRKESRPSISHAKPTWKRFTSFDINREAGESPLFGRLKEGGLRRRNVRRAAVYLRDYQRLNRSPRDTYIFKDIFARMPSKSIVVSYSFIETAFQAEALA